MVAATATLPLLRSAHSMHSHASGRLPSSSFGAQAGRRSFSLERGPSPGIGGVRTPTGAATGVVAGGSGSARTSLHAIGTTASGGSGSGFATAVPPPLHATLVATHGQPSLTVEDVTLVTPVDLSAGSASLRALGLGDRTLSSGSRPGAEGGGLDAASAAQQGEKERALSDEERLDEIFEPDHHAIAAAAAAAAAVSQSHSQAQAGARAASSSKPDSRAVSPQSPGIGSGSHSSPSSQAGGAGSGQTQSVAGSAVPGAGGRASFASFSGPIVVPRLPGVLQQQQQHPQPQQQQSAVPARVASHRRRVLRASHILVCTGSTPRIPGPAELPGLADVPYFTHDTVWDAATLPRRLIVLGGDPAGCEIAQAYARLGAEVSSRVAFVRFPNINRLS
jgi:hypothetical protein